MDIPEKGTKQWIKNESIINQNKVLKDARDTSEGFRPKSSTPGGKGSNYRPVDKDKFDSNWDKIFGKKE